MTSTASLRVLLLTSIWTGRLSNYHLTAPGRIIIRDSLYWVPLFEICLGMRREEVCQLRVRHFTLKFKYLGIDLFAKDIRVKSGDGASRRWIPLSQALLDLGTVECLLAGRHPDDLLFPELSNANAHDAYGVQFGKRFQNYIKNVKPDFSKLAAEACDELEIDGEQRAFMIQAETERLLADFRGKTGNHGFRHWFKTTAENSGGKTLFIEELMGHSNSSRESEGSRYFKTAFVANLKATLDMIQLPFGPKHLRQLAEAAEAAQQGMGRGGRGASTPA